MALYDRAEDIRSLFLSIEDVKMYGGVREDDAVVGFYHILRRPPQPASCGNFTWLRNDVVTIRNVG